MGKREAIVIYPLGNIDFQPVNNDEEAIELLTWGSSCKDVEFLEINGVLGFPNLVFCCRRDNVRKVVPGVDLWNISPTCFSPKPVSPLADGLGRGALNKTATRFARYFWDRKVVYDNIAIGGTVVILDPYLSLGISDWGCIFREMLRRRYLVDSGKIKVGCVF